MTRLKRLGKPGFTLVEILVVISIIGILAGMIVAGAVVAMKKARIARINTELSQLDMGLKTFRNQFHAYPPDGAVWLELTEWDQNGNDIPDDFENFFRQAFPRANLLSELNALKSLYKLDQNAPYSVFFVDPVNNRFSLYNPQTAMVFWLGGMPENYQNANSRLIGFSKNPLHPLSDIVSTTRIGPFYGFEGVNLRNPPGASTTPYLFRACLPPVKTPMEEPYVYFRAEASQRGYEYFLSPFAQKRMKAVRDPNTFKPIVRPYYDARSSAFVNPSSFQILCAGLDGQFFTNNPPAAAVNGDYRFLAFPNGMDAVITRTPFDIILLHYDAANFDDQTNFIQGTIGDEVQ